MAQIAKKTKRFPSDLTGEEWGQIAPLMPKPGRRGRPREIEFREVINAVRYLVRSGCGWRMLPIHFGPWQTVYGWFREFGAALSVPNHPRRGADAGSRAGRARGQSHGWRDRRPVPSRLRKLKTRGYDAGKKIVGRKHHIAVDTDGRLLWQTIQSSTQASMMIEASFRVLPGATRVEHSPTQSRPICIGFVPPAAHDPRRPRDRRCWIPPRACLHLPAPP